MGVLLLSWCPAKTTTTLPFPASFRAEPSSPCDLRHPSTTGDYLIFRIAGIFRTVRIVQTFRTSLTSLTSLTFLTSPSVATSHCRAPSPPFFVASSALDARYRLRYQWR